MKFSSHFRRAAVLGLSLLLAAQLGVGACASSAFDAAYYAETNPDVAAACGTDEASLLRPSPRRRAASPRPGGRPVIA